ncbi:putative NT-type C2 domain-containing protein [Helianthus annuus]|nr:putative NT-type C2 domain-containing protein [Helianthus annuus]
MFKAQRNGKSPSSGEKIDFKFSNFQALQVPKVWDKLSVSIISVETGKTIARTNKALVRNGNCQWTETLSESIWIQHNNSSKELEEHLFKFVVSMGSARCGILGEAMVNMARYYTSSRSSSPVSLPLKKCNYGTILQVKIQCLTPRTKLRYMFVDEDNDHAGSSRPNGSAASLNPKSKSPPTQDLAPTSLLEQIKIMEPSYEPSSSNQNNNSAEHSLEKKTFYQESHINGIKHNIDANSKNSVSKSNKSSLKSMITQDDQEQEYNESSAHVPPSSSVINVGSSKSLLEAAEETIEELRDEARTWEEKTQKLTLGLEILRVKYSDQSKTLAESQIEISSAMAERDSIKKEADHIKMLLEESVVKQKASMESKSTYNSKGQSQRLKELENELKAHKESNIDLSQQLKKSQESNIELVSILQELEETTETQRTEIEELRAVKSTLTELEKSFNSNLMETRSLQLKLKQTEESEKTLQANMQVLEQALENERISNSQTRSDLEKKEEYINNMESKLSETEEIEKNQMREIERLKMKVSEVENECNELTNENLELACELKERNNTIEENHITSICLDNLRNDQMVLSGNLDSQVSANKLLEQKAMELEKDKREMELYSFEMEEENIKLVEHVSELESQLARVKDELEKSESEKQKLQESAENLIEECNTLQKSYEDMTKGNAELYDQYSCLVIELTSETERNQKEVERLKHEISRLDEQKSTLTLEKLSLESSLKENDIHTFRKESERKIQELTTELAVVKKNHKKLIAEHEKKSKLLTSYRIREERIRTDSEHERQQLIEEAANLKEKVSDYKQKLEKLKNEKSNLEASLHSVSNSFEKLKAEKMSFFNKMSEFEDCKSERDALEEKLSRLEGDLTAKNASRLQDANIKNEISRIKSANLQYRLKIQQLEGEKKELLKKVDDLTGVHETRTQEDTDYAAKMKMLEAELDEALNANHKYRVQLQKQKSKGRNTHSSGKSKAEGEVVTKELFEKTKSSLETELKDLRDRYLEMSLKYAQVEAERGDLVMQLKTNSAKK